MKIDNIPVLSKQGFDFLYKIKFQIRSNIFEKTTRKKMVEFTLFWFLLNCTSNFCKNLLTPPISVIMNSNLTIYFNSFNSSFNFLLLFFTLFIWTFKIFQDLFTNLHWRLLLLLRCCFEKIERTYFSWKQTNTHFSQ